MLHLLCGLVFASIAAPPAYPQTILIKTWDKGDWIVPVSGGKALYGQSAPDADFVIAQWDNPTPLSAFRATACAATRSNCFVASSPNIVDSLYTDRRGNRWVDLVSLGTGMACYPAAHAELDNLQEAISPVYRKYPQALRATASLGAVSHLDLSVTVEPLAFSTLAGAQCVHSGVAVTAAVVFNDVVAHQTLFYQLRVHSYQNSPAPGFFANMQPFGFRDMLYKFGVYPNGVPAGVATRVAIDLLPRLKTIISGARNGLDNNVGNWRTGSAYMGQAVFGNVRGDTTWCCLTLTAR